MQLFENKWPALLLWPLSLLYGIIVIIRNSLYDWGVLSSFKVSKPIISIGNITAGGTGKTPLVIFLAKWLKKKGERVCILSRGFKRNSRGTLIVSDGDKILATIDDAGDEPFQMAKELSDVPVIVDEDRVRGARIAIKKFLFDIILLDDGFQHRRLQRDIDIVTFKSTHPLGNGFLLPAGPLREPMSGLKRANLIWVNGNGNKSFRREWKDIPLVRAEFKATSLSGSNWQRNPQELDGKRVIGFCGIGSPEGFKHSLEKLGAEIIQFIVFRDHHKYALNDIRRLENIFKEAHADLLVTTEKDWIKILPDKTYDSHWCYLKIEIETKDNVNLENILSTINDKS
ncbi:MAG: tetraacyldisaccharide 4'-kinase [Actinobacteria bacterium]|nr:tetraacyldisaccharide 4'-kinase [Actinomycetota bacterium]